MSATTTARTRSALGLATLALLASPLAAASASHSPTHETSRARTSWQYLIPFGQNPSRSAPEQDRYAVPIRGPRRTITAAVGAGSAYYMRGLDFHGWGSARATITGTAEYCSDSCEGGRRAITIALTARTRCGDRTGYYYARYATVGFVYLGRGPHIAPSPCDID